MPFRYKSDANSELDGYSQVAVPWWSLMSTEHRTPQTGSVLQVGPLKPSLEQTLADDYARLVLPEATRRARRVPRRSRRGDHRGGDVGPHGRGRRI